MKLWLFFQITLVTLQSNPLEWFYQALHIGAGICEQTQVPVVKPWLEKARSTLKNQELTNALLSSVQSDRSHSEYSPLDCEMPQIQKLFEGTIPGKNQNTKILAVSLALTTLKNPQNEASARQILLRTYEKLWFSLMLLEQSFVVNSPEFQSM